MKKLVEITIPVYNEEKELEKHIEILYNFCEINLIDYNWHITIADNASTDTTPLIIEKIHKKHKEISGIRFEKKGRGRAVRHSWEKSEADFCAYMDLDLSTDLKHLPKIIKALEDGYDIAIGSRLAKGSVVEGRSFIREITSRTLNFFFIQLFFRTHFTDAQCGFKAVGKRVVKNLMPLVVDNGWFFDGEMLIIAEKMGYKIYEEPVHWVDNPGSTVRLVSTVWGDIKVILRLLINKPWKIKNNYGRT